MTPKEAIVTAEGVVFTNKDGKFSGKVKYQQVVNLVAKLKGHDDATKTITVAAEDVKETLTLEKSTVSHETRNILLAMPVTLSSFQYNIEVQVTPKEATVTAEGVVFTNKDGTFSGKVKYEQVVNLVAKLEGHVDATKTVTVATEDIKETLLLEKSKVSHEIRNSLKAMTIRAITFKKVVFFF